MIQFNIYPGGVRRIVTFSYDDGNDLDERLIGLFNRYGVKGTFHLNGKKYVGKTDAELAQIRTIYAGHEISCHTLSHGWPSNMPEISLINETVDDRKILEKLAGYPVVGMSYPCGDYNQKVINALASCGILYSRTTLSTKKFGLPENFLAWHPTCHHRDALSLCPTFLQDLTTEWRQPLFYIWGHSHELKTEENWREIEEILKNLSGNEKIWYATNLEIYDYKAAQRALRVSVDEKMLFNPTAIDVWVEKDKADVICIPAGETVYL